MKKKSKSFSDSSIDQVKKFINRALRYAEESQVAFYVSYKADGGDWMVTITQPPVFQSHWKVLPDARTFAHIAETGIQQYCYEEIE